MLTKLLKYEVRATARMLLPIYGGLVLTWGVYRAYTALCGGLHLNSTIPGIVEVLLLFLYGLTLLAAWLMTVFVNVRQFYRLLGEEGYFLIPLPASAAQHMAAKLLCGVGWMGAFLLLGSLLNGLPGDAATAAEGGIVGVGDSTVSYSFAGDPLSLGATRLLNIGGLGLGVLAVICGYLFIYLCIIIGSHWPRHRALASVLAYFGLLFAGQTVFLGGLVALLNDERAATAIINWFERFADKTQHVNAIAPMLWAVIAIAALVLAAAGVILWAIDHHFVSKRLNIV